MFFVFLQMYMTDPGKQTRVLCFVNKESRGKTLYPGNNMDSECTFLQTFCKKVKWDLQIKKNKTSEVRMAMVFNATFFFNPCILYHFIFPQAIHRQFTVMHVPRHTHS